MLVRAAKLQDVPAVAEVYRAAIEAMRGTPADIEWDMAWHPTRADLARHASDGSLFVADAGKEALAGAFVLNGDQAPAYEEVDWGVQAPAGRVAVLHLLAVHPSRRGAGVGRLLVGEAIAIAAARGAKALRFDVLANNAPALALYRSCGIADLGARDMELAPGFVRSAYPMEIALA